MLSKIKNTTIRYATMPLELSLLDAKMKWLPKNEFILLYQEYLSGYKFPHSKDTIWRKQGEYMKTQWVLGVCWCRTWSIFIQL